MNIEKEIPINIEYTDGSKLRSALAISEDLELKPGEYIFKENGVWYIRKIVNKKISIMLDDWVNWANNNKGE